MGEGSGQCLGKQVTGTRSCTVAGVVQTTQKFAAPLHWSPTLLLPLHMAASVQRPTPPRYQVHAPTSPMPEQLPYVPTPCSPNNYPALQLPTPSNLPRRPPEHAPPDRTPARRPSTRTPLRRAREPPRSAARGARRSAAPGAAAAAARAAGRAAAARAGPARPGPGSRRATPCRSLQETTCAESVLSKPQPCLPKTGRTPPNAKGSIAVELREV